jgi:hypothetical protein
MAKKYTIKTLRDLLVAASETKDLDGLFADLRWFVDVTLAAAAGPKVTPTEVFDAFIAFKWIDDGIREGKIELIRNDNQ